MASRTLRGADKVMDAINAIARKMGNGVVRIGFLEGATYADGTSVAQVAFWNEFGHGGNFPAPPRPFFRNMISNESASWPGKMAAAAKATDFSGEEVLRFMGEDIMGALQQSIIETNAPALSPTTLRLRKVFGNQPENITRSDVLQAQKDVAGGAEVAGGTQAKPLVWTGQLLNSVSFEVKS